MCSGVPAGVRALCGDKYSGKLRDKASPALHAENLLLGIQLQSSTLLFRNTVEKCRGEKQLKKYSGKIQLKKALHAMNLLLGIQLLHHSTLQKYSEEIQWSNTVEKYSEQIQCKIQWRNTVEKYKGEIQWRKHGMLKTFCLAFNCSTTLLFGSTVQKYSFEIHYTFILPCLAFNCNAILHRCTPVEYSTAK